MRSDHDLVCLHTSSHLWGGDDGEGCMKWKKINNKKKTIKKTSKQNGN